MSCYLAFHWVILVIFSTWYFFSSSLTALMTFLTVFHSDTGHIKSSILICTMDISLGKNNNIYRERWTIYYLLLLNIGCELLPNMKGWCWLKYRSSGLVSWQGGHIFGTVAGCCSPVLVESKGFMRSSISLWILHIMCKLGKLMQFDFYKQTLMPGKFRGTSR